jgi:HNH endonuclease
MNPFGYPREKHVRSLSPGRYSNYKLYKPFLRTEFLRQCVYCRLPDGMHGEAAFGVDHYRPASKFPELRSEYKNLFYACNACNSLKGNFWPREDQVGAGLFIPNPCERVMADHVVYRGVLVEPQSLAGEFAVDILQLNRAEDVAYRRTLLHLIESSLRAAETVMRTLQDLDVRILQARGQVRVEMERDRQTLQEELSQIQEDLERLSGSRL